MMKSDFPPCLRSVGARIFPFRWDVSARVYLACWNAVRNPPPPYICDSMCSCANICVGTPPPPPHIRCVWSCFCIYAMLAIFFHRFLIYSRKCFHIYLHIYIFIRRVDGARGRVNVGFARAPRAHTHIKVWCCLFAYVQAFMLFWRVCVWRIFTRTYF